LPASPLWVGSGRSIGDTLAFERDHRLAILRDLLSVTTVSPFFGFVLALVIPGALVILLAALLLTRST
jgi:hypothetical protein